MLRFCFVILVSIPYIIHYIRKGAYIEKHSDQYTEEDRYTLARKVVSVLQRHGRIKTQAFGTEYLPKEGGYVMYANHQGKYDALGIIASHDKPCTVVIDKKRSELPIADQFVTLIQGTRLDKTDTKSQVQAILKVVSEVTSGRRYIIFPEGGYYHNRNDVQEFLPGSFKSAMKAKCPIVPVALIDSYKPFELNSLRSVMTQVHFLPPIHYEEYKGMTSREIATLTRNKIVDVIEQVCKDR